MNRDELLRQITIAEPCRADWNALQGDDRARFCASCGKHVYNLEAMSTDEAACLIRARNGNLCVRMQVREAQPPGSPAHGRVASLCRFHIRFVMAAIAGVGAFLGITRTWWRSEEPSTAQRVRATMVLGSPAFSPTLLPPSAGGPAVSCPNAGARFGETPSTPGADQE